MSDIDNKKEDTLLLNGYVEYFDSPKTVQFEEEDYEYNEPHFRLKINKENVERLLK